MKRLIPILTLAAGALLIVAAVTLAHHVYAQDGHGGAGSTDDAALRGAAVYAEFCQSCHGPRGESTGSGAAFAAAAYDPQTTPDVIAQGRDTDTADGAAMPAYGKVLDKGQIDDLLAYMATWTTDQSPALPEPNIGEVPEHVEGYDGSPSAGAVVYAKFCAGCHGESGQGRGDASFPALKVKAGETLPVLQEGTSSLYMPAFAVSAGGPLSETQLTDLDAYLATWQTSGEDNKEDRGLGVLIVIAGILSVLIIGVFYLRRTVVVSNES